MGQHWGSDGEVAFVARALAAAAARAGEVDVIAPRWPAQPTADGLFDVRGVPAGSDIRQTAGLSPDSVLIVDELGPDLVTAFAAGGFRAGFYLTAPDGPAPHPWRPLPLVPDPDLPDQSPVGPYVPVNPLAAETRHHGFGFTGYVLVLAGENGGDEAPAAADRIGGELPEADVVVVGDATAAAWKGRSLRGRVGVDTRTDLWRLMAHALVCVDLAPGSLIARECVEALRYGTPVIAPAGTGPASLHARASSGRTFGDLDELAAAALEMQVPAKRAEASVAGKAYADRYFGDPDRFVATLATLLG